MQEENSPKHLTWDKYQIFFKRCCILFLHLINIPFIYSTYIHLLFWNISYLQKSCKKQTCLLTFLPNSSMLTFYISILPFFLSLSPSSQYKLFFWNIDNHVVYLPLNILQCMFLNILYNHNIIIKIRHFI